MGSKQRLVGLFREWKVDRRGRVVGIAPINPHRARRKQCRLYRDAKERVCRVEVFDGSGPKPHVRIFEYDREVVRKSRWFDEAGALQLEHHYQYRRGLMVRRSACGPVGETVKYVEVSYDENGDVIEEALFDAFGTLEERTTFVHDEYGNQVEEAKYDALGNLVGTFRCRFDLRGNPIERTWIDETGVVRSSYQKRYDENDNEIETYLWIGGSLVSRRKVSYDRSGNPRAAELTDERRRSKKIAM